MSAPATLWRPSLLGAVGAGFSGDATVQDGVHLRWSPDPRLGLPVTGQRFGFDVGPVGIPEGSIARVDLFAAPEGLPLHSSTVDLGAGPGRLLRDDAGIRFVRPFLAQQWLPVLRYLARRRTLALWPPPGGPAAGRLLDYLDRVLPGFLPPLAEGPPVWELRDVVAVDVDFTRRPGPVPPVGRLRRFIAATVTAFDDSGHELGQDWVGYTRLDEQQPAGRKPQIVWKLRARLRATGIRRVVIGPCAEAVTEQEIRWVCCEEYAANDHLWPSKTVAMAGDPGTYTPDFVREVLFGAHRASRDWPAAAEQVRQLLEQDRVHDALAAEDTFAMYDTCEPLDDTGAGEGTGLPILAALQASALDPAVAALLGLYRHVPDPSGTGRDWRVLFRPPFTGDANLWALEDRAAALLPAGQGPFFHTRTDMLTGIRLAGLVLDAAPAARADPGAPDPTIVVRTGLVGCDAVPPDDRCTLVSASIQATGPRTPVAPYETSTCYETVRRVAGEPDQPVIDDGTAFGILPGVLVPDRTRRPGQVVLSDTFTRPADQPIHLSYTVRGFDIFGRPSPWAGTDTVSVPATCLPPPPPDGVSAHLHASGDALLLDIVFHLDPSTSNVQAARQALRIRVHATPADSTDPPDLHTWSGAVVARQTEWPVDPADGSLHTAEPATTCQELRWEDPNTAQPLLIATPIGDDACSGEYPTGAVLLPESAAGPTGYRATLQVGTVGGLGPGLHAWSARVSVRAASRVDGTPLDSPEVCTTAVWTVPPAPPPLLQPPIGVAVCTSPDLHGTSHYELDLRPMLPECAEATVQVRIGELGRLTAHPDAFVSGTTVKAADDLLALVHATMTGFRPIAEQPHAFTTQQPYLTVTVPGDLDEVYIVAVTTCNDRLQESPWAQAAITLFRPPMPATPPQLRWLAVEPRTTSTGDITVGLQVEALLHPDTDGHPPRLHLLRRSVSSGSPETLLATLTGEPTNPAGRYTFGYYDPDAPPGQRLQYRAQLVAHSRDRGQDLLAGAITRDLLTPGGDPLNTGAPLTVAPDGGGTRIDIPCRAGDFTVRITRSPAEGPLPVASGRIAAGCWYPEEGSATVELTLGDPCVLTVHDPAPPPEAYTVEVSVGQAGTWTRRKDLP